MPLNNVKEIIKKTGFEIDSNKIKDEKDYFLFHQNRFERILCLLDSFDKGNFLLDISSHYLHVLLGAKFAGFKNIFGTDLEIFNSLSAVRAKNIGAVIKNCDLEKEKIPFYDESFDIILLTETLEHLNFHPEKVFKDIFRVLRPGGRVIITTPNLLRINNRLKLIFGKSINSDLKENYSPGTHYREYSSVEIKYLLEASGLKVDKIKYTDFNYPNRSSFEAVVNKIIGAIFPCLKSNLIIIGKK
jgi:SAM-dependent methyltransferase